MCIFQKIEILDRRLFAKMTPIPSTLLWKSKRILLMEWCGDFSFGINTPKLYTGSHELLKLLIGYMKTIGRRKMVLVPSI